MAYTFVNKVGMTTSLSATVTPSGMPAGFSPGDLLVAVTFTNGTGQSVTTPSGWTQLGTTVNSPSVIMFARIAQLGDTAPNFVWTGGLTAADIACFTGLIYTDLTTIVDKYSDRASSSTSLIVTNGASMLPTNNASLCFVAGRIRTTNAKTFGSMPSTFTLLSDASPSGNNEAVTWGYVIQTTATTLATNLTVTVSPSEASAANTQGFAIVLQPGVFAPNALMTWPTQTFVNTPYIQS